MFGGEQTYMFTYDDLSVTLRICCHARPLGLFES
jgi:hypothetical protein